MKKRRNRSPYLTAGLILTGVMAALILLGFFWTPYDPTAISGSAKLSAPSFAHLMGTDNFGRDIFSRVLKGAGTTAVIALSTVLLGGGIGVLVGALTGYFGGIVDEVLMRLNDALNAFPSVLLALVIVSVLGSGKYNVVIALSIVFVPSFARVSRTAFAALRDANYVKSARLVPAHSGGADSAQHPACAASGFYHRLQQRRAGGGLHELSGHRRQAPGCLAGLHAVGIPEYAQRGALVCAVHRHDHCAAYFRRGPHW